MAGEAQDGGWPLPKFYFTVNFSAQGMEASFQEVSGLDAKPQEMENRHAGNIVFSTVKKPGIVKTGNIILKHGIFVNDATFQNWFEAIKNNVVKRETITIQLRDETNNPVMTWGLSNAWPTKITMTEIKENLDEVAVETLEISHEGMTINAGTNE